MRLASLTAAATMFVASPASADWNYTRWGMTPPEVVASSSNSAMLQEMPPAPGQTHLVRAVGLFQVGQMEFDVWFYFDQGAALSIVELRLTHGSCGQVIDGLSGKYGRPYQATSGGSSAFARWRSDEENLQIQSDSDRLGCRVRYRPLRLADSTGL